MGYMSLILTTVLIAGSASADMMQPPREPSPGDGLACGQGRAVSVILPLAAPAGPRVGAVQVTPALPAPADSTALVLSALGGLGVWQLGRSAGRVQLAPLPEWFHSGAPGRVGHCYVAQPDLGAEPAVPFTDKQEHDFRLCLQRVRLESQAGLLPQVVCPVLLAPRPPPRAA